jgi:predicted porin
MLMKRSLLIAALSTVAAGSALAQSSVTVYGRLNESIENQKNFTSDGDKTVLQNNASRLGFKGVEDLGGGLKAGFFLEHRFSADTGVAASPFWAGDSYVSLGSASFGEVKLGRITSAAYYATADYVSLHNHDTGTSEDKLYTYLSHNRNTVAYTTPNFGGFTLEGSVAAGEGEVIAPGVTQEKVYNLAANYDIGGLHLGAGYEKNADDKQYAIRALYELGAFTFGGYYQRSDLEGLGNRNAFRLSGMYTLGASEFHLNAGFADEWSNVADSDAKQYTVAYNYNLSKRTKVYAFYTKVDNSSNAAYFNDVAGRDPSSLALGIRHNF